MKIQEVKNTAHSKLTRFVVHLHFFSLLSYKINDKENKKFKKSMKDAFTFLGKVTDDNSLREKVKVRDEQLAWTTYEK